MTKIRLIFQSLVPWCIFFALDEYGKTEASIAILAAIAFILLFNIPSLKKGSIFDVGSLIFFIMLATVTVFVHKTWFIVNAAMLSFYAIALFFWLSIIIKKPIMHQYAQIDVTKEFSKTPIFYRTNNILTLFWAIIFSVNALLTTIQYYLWYESIWLSEILPIAIILLGFWLCMWFPEWYKQNIVGEWGVTSLPGLSELHFAHASLATIAYRFVGKGPKLILLPPSNSNMYIWDPKLIRNLSKQHQVILIDYPNIGGSKLKHGSFSVENLANAIGEFIINLDDENVLLCGYAMGGWIAQEIAIVYPNYIKKLILIATDVGSSRSMVSNNDVRKQLVQNKGSNKDEIDTLMNLLFPPPAIKAHQAKMHAILTTAYSKNKIPETVAQLEYTLAEKWYKGNGVYYKLGAIHAPTLVITGSQDNIISRQNSLLLVNGIRGAEFLELPDAGHGLIYQYPDAIADRILKL